MPYLFIFATILLTVYGQLVIKWQLGQAGTIGEATADRIAFVLRLALNPWIISSYVAAFLASLTWMVAVRQLELSHAYPFMSLSFVLILIFSGVLFRETITAPKILGMFLIVAGIVAISQT
jgi:multidrug transporter EmrE-like cation transporter